MIHNEHDIEVGNKKTGNPKGYQPRPEQELPPLNVIMERLVQFHRDPKPEKVVASNEDTEKYPALHVARLKADALILRRGGKLPRIREQYVSKAWTEKEQVS